jgi:protein-S-isoprenylcysteine O-methyltransferase Ste14
MKTLELKIPPLALMLIIALFMWLSAPYFPSIVLAEPTRFGIFIATILLAIILILSGAYCFKKANTTVNPTKPESSSTLVTYGIYQYTRNPMYVGFACVLVGWAFFLTSPYLLIWLLVFIAYMNSFQIKPEESMLTSLFSQDFIDYKKQVRRWL